MRRNKICYLILACLFLGGCSVKKQKEELSFAYLGKPIHPSSVETLYSSENKSLDLRTSKMDLPSNEWKNRPGWLITEHKEDAESGRIPFFAYKGLASSKDKFLLLVTYNGGGTGTFDNILVVEKKADELHLLKTLGEGDRCNGGISEDKIAGYDFYYSRNLTPVDILRLAAEVKIDVTAYEDLEASALSCFGLVHYKYNLVDDKEEFLSVTLAEEKEDEEEWTDRYRAQSCFNKIYNSYIKAKKTELSLKDLNEFAEKFRDECLKKASAGLPN